MRASKTSTDWPGPDWPSVVLDHAEYAAALARRRAELGNPELPRNSGLRRTPSKRALHKAIGDAGGTW